MHVFVRFSVLICLITALTYPALSQSGTAPNQQLLKLPLSFEPNLGQTDADVRFFARGAGYALFLTDEGPVLSTIGARSKTNLKLHWAGSGNGRIAAEQPLSGKVNYLRGANPSTWITGVPTYARIRYRKLYPGIDLVLYGNKRQVEYDLVVAPGANLNQVRLHFDGVKKMQISADGDLVLQTGNGELRQHAPVAYQIADGKQHPRLARYVVQGDEVRFEVIGYDPKRELIVDPTLSFQTYLGGPGFDRGFGIAVGSDNRPVITGDTQYGFPTKNPVQPNQPGEDAFVTKMWSTGGGLIWSTYLGGNSGDLGRGVGVDRDGNVYIAGRTQSTDFPVTANAYQKVNHGFTDAFITKLDVNGRILWSTYYGGAGTDDLYGMTIDSQHRIYLAGQTNSSDLPLKNPADAASGQGFVARLNADGASLSYSTYFTPPVQGIAVDSTYHAYVTGNVRPGLLPVTTGAYQTSPQGKLDAFVTKLWATGSGYIYSTYLGGSSDDWGYGIAVDTSNRAYITGQTEAPFPVTAGAYQTQPSPPPNSESSPGREAFVTRMNATGTGLSYSSYLGGTGDELGYSIAVNGNNEAYVAGNTANSGSFQGGPFFPLVNAVQTTGSGFLTKFSGNGAGLIYSTRLAGSNGLDTAYCVRLDGSANAYVSGETRSTDVPTTAGSFDRSYNGNIDGWVAKVTN